MYDYLIVGAGLYGAVCAHELARKEKKVLVIDKRNHIAGNIYTENVEGINVHKYGAHIFHTSDKIVWDYVNQFAEFNNYINQPVARYKNECYNLPFNMNTFTKLWSDVFTPEEAMKRIEEEKKAYNVENPKNLEDQAINLVGPTIYEKLVKGYTAKQWGRPCRELPAFIIKRLPVRFTFDNNYFNDRYQGNAVINYTDYDVPYTRIIEHKHFEFDITSPKTVISKEFSSTWKLGDEPYYPVNNDRNNELYRKYKELSQHENKVFFGGRLGGYKYYDMDDTIMAAFEFLKNVK